MKKRNTLRFPKVLLLLALFTVSCEKATDDTGKDLDKISKEVRASLEGEIVFYKLPSIFKSSAKTGGSGSLIGSDASGQNGLKWSPDGSKIAYIKNSSFNWYLVICSKDGVPEHEWVLGNPFNGFRGITWSPDGNTIAALSTNGSEINYIEIATGKLTTVELVMRPGYFYSSIAWWPKGNKIAVAECRSSYGNSDGNKYIWMLEAFENDPTKNPGSLLLINNDPLITSIEYQDWSVDGTKLVYSGFGTGPVYVVHSDGTGNHQIITKHPFENKGVYGFAPCWMTNNNQIIFVGVTGVSGSTLIFGLFVTDINGSFNIDLNIPGQYPDCY